MFPYLTAVEEAKLLQLSPTRHFRKGTIILAQGAFPDSIFVVRRGRIQIQYGFEGKSRPVGRLRKGEVYDLLSFVAQTPSQFGFVADDEIVAVRAIPKAGLLKMSNDDSRFHARFHQSLSFLLARQLHASYLRFRNLMDCNPKRQHTMPPSEFSQVKSNAHRVAIQAEVESLPHVMHELVLHWGRPSCRNYLNDLLVNPTGMDRQGLPFEVFSEIMFLHELVTN